MTESRRVEWSEIEPEKRRLAVSTLRFSERTQPRQEIDPEWVDDLEERMQAGENGIVVDRKDKEFDPLVVFYDGNDYLVADGHHRGRAARQHPDIDRIQVELYEGDRRDAVLYSVGANAEHGKQRSTQDKRQAVLTMLTDDGGWKQWSDREIARQTGTSSSMVNRLRNWLEDTKEDYESPDERKYKVGSETRTMDVSEQRSNDDAGDTGPVSWTVGDEDSEPEDGDTPTVAQDEPQFEEMPAALDAASYVQYDFVSESTIATGPVRQCLEEIAPVDMIITRGPEGPDEWSELTEAAAHTLADDGLLVTVVNKFNHVEANSILSRRVEHTQSQLLQFSSEKTDWSIATYWNRSPIVEPGSSFEGNGWKSWARAVADSAEARNIAVPYADDDVDVLRGLIGPDTVVTALTSTQEKVDGLCDRL